MEKGQTACFTGHRSQKLPWKFNEEDERCLKMKQALKEKLISAIERGYETFISGMALGFDMISVEALLELKKKYNNIKIIGALPCRNQYAKWPESQVKRYKKLLEQLDDVHCENEEYTGPQCMLDRNKFMVNNSSLLIALFNGLPGGTKSTIDYAKKCGLEVEIIKP